MIYHGTYYISTLRHPNNRVLPCSKAGREASIALARSSLSESDANSTEPLSALTPGEKDTLDEWMAFFEGKYEVVGEVKEE